MQTRDDFLSLAFYRPLIFNGIRILFILLFAYIATAVIERVIHGLRAYVIKAMLRAQNASEYEVQKRAQTVGGVVRKSIVSVVWVVAAIMILQEMNFDVRPLLAGAGVVGLAVGFGAQTLVKDVLAGLFLLLDNQIRLNDVVVINGTGGLVEELNLRTTLLRSEDGAVHLFNNGSIAKFSNLTRDYSFWVFSLLVSYGEDSDRVIQVLKGIGDALMAEEPYHSAILAPIEIMGVDQLADSGFIVKARIKTLPIQQWTVGRELNRRINKTFHDAGIQLPYPTRTVHLVQDPDRQWKNELKQAIREVMAEKS